MNRITIDRTIWGKLKTQLQKPDNATTAAAILQTKITLSPESNSILWEPSKDVVRAIRDILLRERGFIRKTASAPYTRMTENLNRLQKYLDSQ